MICLAGAELTATLDGEPVPYWQPIAVKAGQVLTLGGVDGPGARAYLAVRGGIDVPKYLGSRSTFTLGKFGGHGGRALRAGDVLHVGERPAADAGTAALASNCSRASPTLGTSACSTVRMARRISSRRTTSTTFFAADWEVHYNSKPTGVRLIGPKPDWAREDGGEAGLHPSNIHDNAYAIGTIDFTGDMPVILGPDGPSSGGFVCPATIAQAELWKMGQLRPGDKVRFVAHAGGRRAASRAARRGDRDADPVASPQIAAREARRRRLHRRLPRRDPGHAERRLPPLGRRYLLVEYGPIVLDLTLRFRVHALMQALGKAMNPGFAGILDLTPGIRSLQIHYDTARARARRSARRSSRSRTSSAISPTWRCDSRIVHLPLSWDDAAVQAAIDKYMQRVRADAPWCPSNIEFIRRINGLDSIDEVKRIVFDASYLVLGLGDVYLGAPVATPVDPRHRLVTTKYNPARTWTPENAVGIGGAYLCVYGMEGPGGYQFVGRTCQMWNTYRATDAFEPGKPWLLRFFDQIRFYPVSGEELLDFRDGFLAGKRRIEIIPATFRLARLSRLSRRQRREDRCLQDAPASRLRCRAGALANDGRGGECARGEDADDFEADGVLPPGATAIESPVPGSVWKILVEPGAQSPKAKR